MYADIQTSSIINAGLRLLRENLGALESEIFITHIGANKFDYTKWRVNLWSNLTAAELFERAAATEDLYGIPENVDLI